MVQGTLFDSAAASGSHCTVRFHPSLDAWRAATHPHLAAGTAPDRLWWLTDPDAPRPEPGARRVPLTREFAALAASASCHRAGDRWALLYACVSRLCHDQPHLLERRSDPLVLRLHRYAQAVRRDAHKMKAFVRFREIDPGDGEPRYIAWFEPDHHIVERVAPFFRDRFTNMRWSILTPERCAHWEGAGELWFSAGADRSKAPASDALEAAWRVYFRSIFNPARLKTEAMRAEMPQKYWKNLPEARLIPELIRDANRRVHRMTAAHKSEDVLQCGPRPRAPRRVLADATRASAPGSLERLALAARACDACPLSREATRTVTGEGPAGARIMLLGEQPGDREDLAGRPFVGPAGALLDRALADAGIERASCYLTNAVKHFHFEPRGTRRLHRKPDLAHVDACRPWLEAELAIVQPEILVCLGATAARAYLGKSVRVHDLRGHVLDARDPAGLVTVHPAWLLRLPDGRAGEEFARFVGDLRTAASASSRTRLPGGVA